MQGFPSGAVCASADEEVGDSVAKLFQNPTMKVWTTKDVAGVELAGALKNVYAIASGALEGLGLGLNTTAMLCTRAISEMNKFAQALGGQEATLSGLSGVGDMVLTCFGKLSRNRSVGVRLGKGETLAEILGSMTEVAEGVATAPAALRLAHTHKIAVPIIEAVCAVLEGSLASPLPALMALLALPAGEETR
jgi:glycerol-3-phosphate dehydrogenase